MTLTLMEPEARIRPVTGRQKLVMSLRKAGYSVEDIAGRLQVSVQAVYQAIRRGESARAQRLKAIEQILEEDP